MKAATRKRLIQREINKPTEVEQYQFIEGTKKHVLKRIDYFAAHGWRLRSFGFQSEWYALMVRWILNNTNLLDKLTRI
jgi:hypothetical protein